MTCVGVAVTGPAGVSLPPSEAPLSFLLALPMACPVCREATTRWFVGGGRLTHTLPVKCSALAAAEAIRNRWRRKG